MLQGRRPKTYYTDPQPVLSVRKTWLLAGVGKWSLSVTLMQSELWDCTRVVGSLALHFSREETKALGLG